MNMGETRDKIRSHSKHFSCIYVPSMNFCSLESTYENRIGIMMNDWLIHLYASMSIIGYGSDCAYLSNRLQFIAS